MQAHIVANEWPHVLQTHDLCISAALHPNVTSNEQKQDSKFMGLLFMQEAGISISKRCGK